MYSVSVPPVVMVLLVYSRLLELSTGAARVPILPPCSTDIWILFVDHKIEILDILREADARKDSGYASTDMYHFQRPCIVR